MEQFELLDELANRGMEPVVGEDGRPVALPAVNDLVGKVKIEAVIGYGGIGVVFRGKETDLEVDRAIKMPFPKTGKQEIERFKTEVKICAKLKHPNIVHVYSVGYWKGVLPYAVMDYVKGRNLSEIIKTEPLPPPVALAVIAILCQALEYARTQVITIDGKGYNDLVHRDIKPANVLISENGLVKLTDFGLAKFEGFDLNHTVHGTMPGTIPYMAPEQHQAPIATVSTDIYSLGVTLYELISGQRPFPEKGSDGLIQMLSAKGSGRFPKLSEQVKAIHPKLDRIISACLNPDAGKRYQTYGMLKGNVIGAFEEYARVEPRDIIKLYFCNRQNYESLSTSPLKRWIALPKVFFLLGAGLMLLGIIVGVGFLAMRALQKSPPPPRGVQTFPLEEKPRVHPSFVMVSEPKAKATNADTARRIVSSRNKEVSMQVRTRTEPTLPLPASQAHRTISEPRPEDPFTQAARAYHAGDLDKVLSDLRSLSFDTLTAVRRDSAVIMTIESYYRKGMVNEGLLFSTSYPVNDAKFFLVTALLYDVAGMVSDADKAFNQAISAPEKFEKGLEQKGLLYRARFFQRIYEKDRTESAKEKMVAAWSAFIQRGCASSSKDCEEARTIVGIE
jgi:serine/threonine protein kinase